MQHMDALKCKTRPIRLPPTAPGKLLIERAWNFVVRQNCASLIG